MNKTITTTLAALALAASGAAFAHPGASHDWQAKRQAHMQKRLAKLKAELQITPAEENAWNGYTTALKGLYTPPSRTTAKQAQGLAPAPQVVDAMARRASARADRVQKFAAAVKSLYQALNAKQRAVLDTRFADMRAKMHHHHRRMKQMMHRHHTMHPQAPASSGGKA